MSIKLISKHRSELMAIALIWVAFYHSRFPIDNKLISLLLVKSGYGGVSLFLFLSGFSMYYSYKKDNNYLSFIKKRFLRIVPFCIFLIPIYMLVKNNTFSDACLNAFGIYWFLGISGVNWFTFLMLILYIFTPIYLKRFNNNETVITIISMFFVINVTLLIKNYNWIYGITNICLYLLGIYFAYLNENDVKLSYLLVFILFLSGWILLYLMLHYYRNDVQHVYPMILITPSMLLISYVIIEKIPLIQKPLRHLGSLSYQFYLLHELVITVLYNNYAIFYRPNINFDWLINFGAFIITILFSFFYKHLIDGLIKVMTKRS